MLQILMKDTMVDYTLTERRINNGFVRLGHSILEFSDRDIQRYYKNYKDFNGSKALNNKLKRKLVIILNQI